MYQRRSIKNDDPFHAYVADVQAKMYETTSPALLKRYTNTDLGRDLMSRGLVQVHYTITMKQ